MKKKYRSFLSKNLNIVVTNVHQKLKPNKTGKKRNRPYFKLQKDWQELQITPSLLQANFLLVNVSLYISEILISI